LAEGTGKWVYVLHAPILYWRKGKKQGQSLTPAPFKSEQEFEQTVFDTPAILSDIYLLQRQSEVARNRESPTSSELILRGVCASSK
jgi:hypothetical protein